MRKYKYIILVLGILVLFCTILFFYLRYERDYRLMKEGNILVEKIENFRMVHNRLPNSLNEIGVEEKQDGIDTLYYDKKSSLHYIVYFGMGLGESKTFYSDSKQWEDFDRGMADTNLFANLPMDEYVIIDKSKNVEIRLGIRFSEICQIYPNLLYYSIRKYSNITFKQYPAEGIIFSISAFAKPEEVQDADVRLIEIFSNRYSTKRGVTIGTSKEEVLSKYGNADYIDNNSYYYYNEEWDVMELMFKFDENGLVSFIYLAAGT